MSYIFIARWFGFISVVLSLGILFNLEDSKLMAKNLIKNESGYIMGGVLPIIFGSYSLMLNNAFEISWQFVVTTISLMTVMLGIYRVFFVTSWKHLMQRHADKIPPLFGLFGLIVGILLLYVGFVSDLVSYDVAFLDI